MHLFVSGCQPSAYGVKRTPYVAPGIKTMLKATARRVYAVSSGEGHVEPEPANL